MTYVVHATDSYNDRFFQLYPVDTNTHRKNPRQLVILGKFRRYNMAPSALDVLYTSIYESKQEDLHIHLFLQIYFR